MQEMKGAQCKLYNHMNLAEDLESDVVKEITNSIIRHINQEITINLATFNTMVSEFRAGTFWKNSEGDHIYLHDGYKTADGYCMVCFLNKKKGLIEWSSGRGNLCYSGKMIPASIVDIQDMMIKMTYERQKYYYGS